MSEAPEGEPRLAPRPARPGLWRFLLVVLSLAILPFLFTGCASRPQLYPNQKYKEMGEHGSKADIERCVDEADRFLESPRGKKIAKGLGAGAIIGGAAGGAMGIFTGNIGRGAAMGAAAGGAGGAAAGALSPDEIKQRYVNKCLADKGYEVIGWD